MYPPYVILLSMIRTQNNIQEWQKERGVELIRTGMEDIGLRYLKSEALLPTARLYVETKTDYDHIQNQWDYAPMAIIPRQTRNTVKVAYDDTYNSISSYVIDEMIHKRNWNNADKHYTGWYSGSFDDNQDKNRGDKRYHVFRAADLELIIEKPGDIKGIVLFRDIDTDRQLIVRGNINMFRR